MPSPLLDGLPLVDGHCHPVLAGPVDATTLEQGATEASVPAPTGVSYLDSPVGLAIRRWCAPVLGLPAGAPVADYVEQRLALRQRLLDEGEWDE